jgi:hypothetical protein
MNKNVRTLIADIAYKCVSRGINFHLEYVDKVDADTLPCSGYFDEKSLVVAVKASKVIDWLDVLVHESCHLDQFLEKAKVWSADKDSLVLVEGWIANKNISFARASKGFKNTIALELDCEKRTIRKLKKYNIKFNEKHYIQKANAYLYSYGYTLKYRKWLPQPYRNKKIVQNMPCKFDTIDNYLNPQENILQYF